MWGVLLGSIWLILSATPALAIPTTFAWQSHGGRSSALSDFSYGFYDTDGTTPLQGGDLVQLIWVGANGAADPPDPATGRPGGDDQLVDTNRIDPNSAEGYVAFKTTNYDTAAPYNGGKVYIRAWNGAVLPGGEGDIANAYADSLDAVALVSNGGHNFATATAGERAKVRTFTAVGLTTMNVNPTAVGAWLWLAGVLGLATARAWLRRLR